MKWIALALIAIGIVLILWAINSDRSSSFDDGSFLLQMAAVVGGGVLVIAGVVWMGVLLFMAAPVSWLARFWCALRDHPYPKEWNREAHQEWLNGNEPFAPLVYCSNCGAEIKMRRGGMRS